MFSGISRRAHRGGIFALALAAAILYASAAHAQGGATFTVVASGLEQPKQPVVGPDGQIYVALSGNAAPTDATLDGVPFNKSGSVVKISPSGGVTGVVSGLLSRFDEGSSSGPSGLAWWDGSLYIAQALYDPLNNSAGSLLSSAILKVSGGKTRVFTSLQAQGNDPSKESEPDTNPFAMTVGSDGLLYVADGGENGVWRVERNGDSSLFVQFPGDPTVTGIAAPGRRGSKWDMRPVRRFGGLVVCLFGNGASGFANGSVVTVGDDGGYNTLVPQHVITMPIAAAFSPSGKLYILQFATPNTQPGPPFAPGTGAIWSVSNTGVATKVLSGLNWPTGITFANDGTAYVTNGGILHATGEATGQLVKVTGLQ